MESDLRRLQSNTRPEIAAACTWHPYVGGHIDTNVSRTDSKALSNPTFVPTTITQTKTVTIIENYGALTCTGKGFSLIARGMGNFPEQFFKIPPKLLASRPATPALTHIALPIRFPAAISFVEFPQ